MFMAVRSLIVENFRGFSGETHLSLKPITILIGRNSSGKSSLVRLVPLIQQSISTASSAPLLWDGDLVDFGSISEIVSRANPDAGVKIGFQILAPKFISAIRLRSRFFYYHDDEDEPEGDAAIDIKYLMKLHNDSGKTRFAGAIIQVGSQEMALEWDVGGSVDKIKINEKTYPLADLDLRVSLNEFIVLLETRCSETLFFFANSKSVLLSTKSLV